MNEGFSLLIALGLGALVGFERKLDDRTAGIHTHALVAVGAALFVMLGLKLTGDAKDAHVAAQIVTGIGFLCAGVVMREGEQVKGLNTAATIWCCAAIGALIGAGAYQLGLYGALAVIAGNYLLHLVEHRSGWFPKKHAGETSPPRSKDA